MPGEVVSLKTRDELVKYLQNHAIVIVKFTATWCGPCKRITPLVNELYSKLPNNVSMVIVDIDTGRDISSAMKIRSVPTMYNFVNGSPMDSVIGSKEDNVISFFKKTMARASS